MSDYYEMKIGDLEDELREEKSGAKTFTEQEFNEAVRNIVPWSDEFVVVEEIRKELGL